MNAYAYTQTHVLQNQDILDLLQNNFSNIEEFYVNFFEDCLKNRIKAKYFNEDEFQKNYDSKTSEKNQANQAFDEINQNIKAIRPISKDFVIEITESKINSLYIYEI